MLRSRQVLCVDLILNSMHPCMFTEKKSILGCILNFVEERKGKIFDLPLFAGTFRYECTLRKHEPTRESRRSYRC